MVKSCRQGSEKNGDSWLAAFCADVCPVHESIHLCAWREWHLNMSSSTVGSYSYRMHAPQSSLSLLRPWVLLFHCLLFIAVHFIGLHVSAVGGFASRCMVPYVPSTMLSLHFFCFATYFSKATPHLSTASCQLTWQLKWLVKRSHCSTYLSRILSSQDTTCEMRYLSNEELLVQDLLVC